MLASAAAASLFGVPVFELGTLDAAWVEVSHWLTALQK